MMKHSRICLAFLLGLITASPTHAQSQRRDALEMAESAERRIKSSIQDYLGPNVRSIVNVYIKEAKPQSLEAPNSGDTNPGNLALPGSYIPRGAEAFSDPSQFVVDSAEVVIQVEKNVTDEMQKEIRAISARVLRGMKTDIKLSANLDSPVAAQADGERGPASEKTPLEMLLEKFGGAMPVVAALIIVIGLLAAFGMLGFMLKSSAKEVVEGIKIVRTQVSNSGSQKIELSGDFGKSSAQAIEDKSESKSTPLLPPIPFTGTEARRQIESVEGYLLKMPLLFVRAVGDQPEDLMGLKFLVAKVSPEAKAKLKELLGTEKILQASSFQAGNEVIGFDARGWIQRLIERIEIRQLAGGSVVEESLGTEESLLLSSAPESALFEEALKKNEPAIWRVATDFISSEYLKKRSSELDEAGLENLIVSSTIHESKEVSEAARKLIEAVRYSASESNVLGKSRKESQEHFSTKLLPSFVDAILSKELGEDDKLLARLADKAPEFEKVLHEKIWTPAKLDLLADDTLRSVFERLDSDRKAHLIFILPAKHAQRLESFLPEGNAKKIALDMVSKFKGTVDDRTREAMKALAREFLDFIRTQVLSGNMKLKDGVNLPGSAPRIQTRSVNAADSEVVEAELNEDSEQDDQRKAS